MVQLRERKKKGPLAARAKGTEVEGRAWTRLPGPRCLRCFPMTRAGELPSRACAPYVKPSMYENIVLT